METIITLLTVTVILLSVVILALLVMVTVVLIKVNQLVKNFDRISHNVASATEWLSPSKVFGEISSLFRK